MYCIIQNKLLYMYIYMYVRPADSLQLARQRSSCIGDTDMQVTAYIKTLNSMRPGS